MDIHEQRQHFLNQLAAHGWQNIDLANAPSMQYPEAARDLAESLLSYWQQQPTLERFADLVNTGVLLDLSPSAQNEFIAQMNHAYLDRQTELPQTVSACYRELAFWDQCPMKRCVDHFDRIGKQLLHLLQQDPSLPPEIISLIQNERVSDQMTPIRHRILDLLRNMVRGNMAAQITPRARIETLLFHATGEIGSYLVDDSLWRSALQTAIQSSRTKADIYIPLRQALLEAEKGRILDHPQITLEHIHSFLQELDHGVGYGRHLDAQAMLTYWRSLDFASIPENDLLAIYQAFLKKHPDQTRYVVDDITLLQKNGRETLAEKLEALSDSASANPKGDDMNGRRTDGYRGRSKKSKSATESQSIRRLIFGGIGIAAVLLALILLMKILPSPSASPDAPTEETKTEAPPKTNKPEKQEEKSSMPSEIPEETDAPAKTETPTPSPSESFEIPEENEPTPEPILDEPIAVEDEQETVVSEDEGDAIPVE